MLTLLILGVGGWFLYRALKKSGADQGEGSSGRINKISSPDQLYTFTRAGIVEGSTTWAETSFHTTTTGGSGYLHNGTGHVSAPSTTTSSTTTRKSRFFLREDDGDEIEVNLTDTDFSVRDGHRVILAYAGDTVSRRGWIMCLHNLQTGKRTMLRYAFAWLRGENLGFWKIAGLLILVGFVTWALVSTFLTTTILTANRANIDTSHDINTIMIVTLLGTIAGWFFVIRYSFRRAARVRRLDAAIHEQLNAKIDARVATLRTPEPAPLAGISPATSAASSA